MKEVAAIRGRRTSFAFSVALGGGGSDQRPDRALGLTIRDFPIKAIVLAFVTVDLLGVLVVLHRVVFLLRSHNLLADTDGGVLVAAYSAAQRQRSATPLTKRSNEPEKICLTISH
jgi:hypothetical protein